MEDYLHSLITRRKFLELRKRELEQDLVPIIKELTTLEELIFSVSGEQSYPRKGNIREKVLFILGKIKSGSYQQIKDAMLDSGDSVNETSLKITCASMARSGEINILKTSGRTNIYTL